MFEWFVCLVFGCLLPNPALADPAPPPEVLRIISVVGQSTMGHACPVMDGLAITAGHVAISQRLFGDPAQNAYRGESTDWKGYLTAKFASDYEDAGFLASESPFPYQFKFAMRPALVGERLWWVGFDWRKKGQAGARRVFSGKVVSTPAGAIFFDVPTDPGSSGSCVLDADGKIVGVIAWAMGLQDQNSAAVAVGLWAPWFKVPQP